MKDESTNPATVLLYQSEDGQATLDVQLQEGTVWLTHEQMVELFHRDKRMISRDIRNIFKEGELRGNAVVRKSRITAADGKNYRTTSYNLDFIISVGCRVKSQRGTPCPARRNIRSSPEEIDDPADRQSAVLRHDPAPRGGFAWMIP